MAFIRDFEPGDVIRIGEQTVIKVEHKSGGRARLRIESDYPIRLDLAKDKKPDQPGAVIKRPTFK